MVDIERKGLTLDDWTKGISVDEFAGGSYYFSDGIQSGYDTKGFKLGNRVYNNKMNERTNGYTVAIVPTSDYGAIALTYDGRMEGVDINNGTSKGAIYATYHDGKLNYNYLNGLKRGKYIIGIRSSAIDVIDVSNAYNEGDELITEPNFDDGGSGWTVGTGWTITDDGAEHTTGETDDLVANLTDTLTNTDVIRVAIKISGCTAGSVTPYVGTNDSGAGTVPNTEFGKNGWFVFSIKGSTSATTVTITPTSTFDGVIETVDVCRYDIANDYVMPGKASLYNGSLSDKHPSIIRGGDLYICSRNYVNIVNLSDWGVTYKNLVDSGFEIVAITQQAGNLILWATDGYDSKQYYWNGVDRVASEVIERKGLIIKGVVGTETLSYVLTTAGQTEGTVDTYEYRLYAVSGYQRSLLANKSFFPHGVDYDSPYYHKEKRFEFNDVASSESMTMFLDSLYLPGCDGIYKYGSDIPGMKSTFTRPIKYETGAKRIVLGHNGNLFYFSQRVDGVNYIGEVNLRRYLSRGYVVTNSIYRDKLSTRKTLEKLKIGYKNLASEDGGINIYAIVNDDYFWRFEVSGVTTRPEIGDIYTVANQVKAEVINVNKTSRLITFRTTENKGGYAGEANATLAKVSGVGDNSITVEGFDNMCLVKEIKSTEQGYGSDLIFGKDFVNNYMPYRYKIQLVIELYSIDTKLTPEVYEISIASDIADETI